MKEKLQQKMKNELQIRPRNHEHFWSQGLSWSPLATPWVVLGCLGALLEDLVEIFAEVGAKISPRWTQDGPSWQQVAPKMGHDGAEMSWEGFGGYVGRCWLQDGDFFEYLERCCGILVPRWRTGAPRRGKIGELSRRGLLQGGRDPCGRTRPAPAPP